MKEYLNGIIWGAPQYFYLAPIIVVMVAVIWLYIVRVHRVKKRLTTPVSSWLLVNFSSFRYILKALLLTGALLALLIALLRPQHDLGEKQVAQEGRDIFIALDVSRSMLAQDFTPSRLAFTQQKIVSLLQLLPAERVGLILFSGSSVVQCPLTRDVGAFFMFLKQAEVGSISSGTTAIEGALKNALKAFQRAGSKNNKILVLFTDGEDFSPGLAVVRQEAKKEHMTIFAIGVGSLEGVPIPLHDIQGKPAGHVRDKKGSVVISRLHEKLLQSLAQETGGYYLRATTDDTDIQQLAKYVQNIEKEMTESRKITVQEELYPYVLAVALACLGLEWLL